MNDPLENFFGKAKIFRLTDAEKKDIAQKIGIDVRDASNARLPPYMDAEHFLAQAKKVSLSASEKASMKESVFAMVAAEGLLAGAKDMKLSPAERAHMKEAIFAEIGSSPIRLWNPLKIFTSVFAVFILLVGAGSGISYAAESSLPGDFLYSVKVNVNERVRASLKTSADDIAAFETELVERRLAEAEALARTRALTEEKKELIRIYLKRSSEKVQAHLADLAEKKEAALALALGAEFESSLSAHDSELRSIKAETKDGGRQLDDLLADVTSARLNAEETLVTSEKDRTEDDAVTALAELMKKTEAKINAKKDTPNPGVAAAVDAIVEAQSSNSVDEKAKLIRRALRAAKEAEINSSASVSAEDDSVQIGTMARLRVTEKKLKALKEKMNSSVSIDTETKIGGAEQLLHIGKLQLEAGAHSEALDAAKQALKEVQEAELVPAAPEMHIPDLPGMLGEQ